MGGIHYVTKKLKIAQHSLWGEAKDYTKKSFRSPKKIIPKAINPNWKLPGHPGPWGHSRVVLRIMSDPSLWFPNSSGWSCLDKMTRERCSYVGGFPQNTEKVTCVFHVTCRLTICSSRKKGTLDLSPKCPFGVGPDPGSKSQTPPIFIRWESKQRCTE